MLTTESRPQVSESVLLLSEYSYRRVRGSGLTLSRWGFQQGAAAQGGQFNHAAVSYACQSSSYISHASYLLLTSLIVGSSDQNNGNIHLAKQIWQVVPCGSSQPGSGGIQLSTHNKGHKKPASPGGGSSGKKCSKSGKWLAKHWQYVSPPASLPLRTVLISSSGIREGTQGV